MCAVFCANWGNPIRKQTQKWSPVTDAPTAQDPDHVTVAMCTFNGAAYLDEQLQSLSDQTHTNWSLWVSDDGSTDHTINIIRDFAHRHAGCHDVTIIKGPRAGAAENFLRLLHHPEFPINSLVALADQDDIWLPHKLERAVACLRGVKTPAVYGAQSLHANANGTPKGRSRRASRTPDFGTALAQNIISGHSTVINANALAVVRSTPTGLPHHDWWVHLAVAAADGTVIADDETVLIYRQHSGNVMGAHTGFRAAITRLWHLFDGTYGAWFAANTSALSQSPVSDKSRAVLADLCSAPRSIGLRRARIFAKHGIVRQSRLQTTALWIAVALGRV